MAEPRIYTKNYITGDNAYTISHGASTKANLYDYDKDTKFQTTGANDDATLVSIIVEFYEGTSAISRTIDAMFLLNHNLKNWTAYYWDGAAWQTWTSETGNTGANSIKTGLTSRTTSKIKIECDVTIVADAEKFIGEFMVCALRLDIGTDMMPYEGDWRDQAKELTMGDGSDHEILTRFTRNRTEKYGAKAVFDYLSESTLESLLSIKQTGQPFLWYPETTQRPDEIYLCRWKGRFNPRYSIPSVKTSGYHLEMEVREV